MFDGSNINLRIPIAFGLLFMGFWPCDVADASTGLPACTQLPNRSGGIRIFNCRLASEAGTSFAYSVCLQRSVTGPEDGDQLEIELGEDLTFVDIDRSCTNMDGTIATLTWSSNPMGLCDIPINGGSCKKFTFSAALRMGSQASYAKVKARYWDWRGLAGCHEDMDELRTGAVATPTSCVDGKVCSTESCPSSPTIAPNLCRDDRALVFSSCFERGNLDDWSSHTGISPGESGGGGH